MWLDREARGNPVYGCTFVQLAGQILPSREAAVLALDFRASLCLAASRTMDGRSTLPQNRSFSSPGSRFEEEARTMPAVGFRV